LVTLAASSPQRARSLGSWFLEALDTCRGKDLLGWTEQVVFVLDSTSRKDAVSLLKRRLDDVPTAGARRKLERLIERVAASQ
jgi:hypothetical protein